LIECVTATRRAIIAYKLQCYIFKLPTHPSNFYSAS